MKNCWTIFIVGTTAVGKTKLSLKLAKRFPKAQIISCDSMQLYRNANIMTAKSTQLQQKQVKHHMVDLLELHQKGYNRNRYFSQSWNIIKNLKSNDKPIVPIVIGGTNYYIQTLLYNVDVENRCKNSQDQQQINQSTKNQKGQVKQKIDDDLLQLSKMSDEDKYKRLVEIDPLFAPKIHKNDKQRVESYLKRYIQSGKKPSDNYIEYTHELRDANTILFWIRNQDKQELKYQMKKRIDKMIDRQGLLQIISIFLALQRYQQNISKVIQEGGGIIQSIGYKQFAPFIVKLKQQMTNTNFIIPKELVTYVQIYNYLNNNYNELRQIIHNLKQTLQQCKQILLNSTYQYSKRQVTWIKNRIFNSQKNKNNFFVLDIGNVNNKSIPLLDRFNNQVEAKAYEILECIQKNGIGSVVGGLPQQELKRVKELTKGRGLGEWKRFNCEICNNKQVRGDLQWKQHLRSKNHKLALKSMKKQQQRREKNKDKSQQQMKEKQETIINQQIGKQ